MGPSGIIKILKYLDKDWLDLNNKIIIRNGILESLEAFELKRPEFKISGEVYKTARDLIYNLRLKSEIDYEKDEYNTILSYLKKFK